MCHDRDVLRRYHPVTGNRVTEICLQKPVENFLSEETSQKNSNIHQPLSLKFFLVVVTTVFCWCRVLLTWSFHSFVAWENSPILLVFQYVGKSPFVIRQRPISSLPKSDTSIVILHFIPLNLFCKMAIQKPEFG